MISNIVSPFGGIKDSNANADVGSKEVHCPMCSKKYNGSSQEPRMFPGCGHSLCKECITKIYERSSTDTDAGWNSNLVYVHRNNSISSQPPKKITCFACRSIHIFIDPQNWISFFSVNNKILASVNKDEKNLEDKKNCHAHERRSNSVCLDNKCKSRRIGCIICIKDCHNNCENALIFDSDSAKEQIKYSPPSEWFEKLTSEIKTLAKKIPELIDVGISEHFDRFTKTITERYMRLDVLNVETLEPHLGNFHLILDYSAEGRKYQLTHNRKNDIEKVLNFSFIKIFIEHRYKQFLDQVWTELDKILKQAFDFSTAPHNPAEDSSKLFFTKKNNPFLLVN
jgi:hypothetical protein